MPYTLFRLIKASGNTGASGQSFKNHVTGAASGTKVSDYKCTAWSFGGDFPNNTDDPYDDLRAFTNMTIDFTQGSKATNIKRTGAARIQCSPSGPDGTDATISSNVVGADTGSTATVTMRAPFRTDQTASYSVNFTSGSTPPPGSGSQEVTWKNTMSSGTNTPQSCSFNLSYDVDTGPFNGTLTKLYTFDMNQRVRLATEMYAAEWHNNSSYTDLHANYSFTTMSSPGDPTVTYYFRYKITSLDSWQNVGAVTWTDPRDS